MLTCEKRRFNPVYATLGGASVRGQRQVAERTEVSHTSALRLGMQGLLQTFHQHSQLLGFIKDV